MGTTYASAVIVAALLLGACRPGPFRRAMPGEAVGVDRVVVFGSARFDPPIVPPGRSRNPMFSGITVAFSFEPNTPFNNVTWLPQVRGWTYAPIDSGMFVVEAPRQEFYVRSIAVYLRRVYGRVFFTAGTLERERTDEFVVCDDNLHVTPQPTDEHIYIGTFTCRHQDAIPVDVTVSDEMGSLALPSGVRVERRLAVRDTPLTPVVLPPPRRMAPGVRAILRRQ